MRNPDISLPGWLFWALLLCFQWVGVAVGDGTDAPEVPASPRVHADADAEAGMLLVARRGMSDPRFRKSVILLTTHDDGGSLGIIINRASVTPLQRVLPEVGKVTEREYPVYFGGPVGMNRVMFLVRHAEGLARALHVLDDLYFSGDRSTLEKMLLQGKSESELRVYVGYAGWGPGQLAGELSNGDWLVVPATLEMIFSDAPGALWDRLMDRYVPSGNLVWSPAAPTCRISGRRQVSGRARLPDSTA